MTAKSQQTFPSELEEIFTQHQDPDAVFSALLPALVRILECDRAFLYLRNPQTKMGRVPYCWCKDASIPEVYDPDWKPEPDSLVREDPMFAAAVRTDPSIFVEDVETASPEVLNVEFERENFGHRALVHAHICHDNQLWGVLQPSVFGRPRVWSDRDRYLISEVVQRIRPIVVAYVA